MCFRQSGGAAEFGLFPLIVGVMKLVSSALYLDSSYPNVHVVSLSLEISTVTDPSIDCIHGA